MALENINGNAFVAFTDIAGFKKMLVDGNRAAKALDYFYNCGYDILNVNSLVKGLFVSDSGILIVPCNSTDKMKLKDNLVALLKVIKELNIRMLDENYMLTTSIAFGYFKYENRLEFPGMSKDMILGHAYLNAYLDNENRTNKLDPGQCRIVCDNDNTVDIGGIAKEIEKEYVLELVKKEKRIYFHWYIEKKTDIKRFRESYQLAKNSVYERELEILQEFNKNR